MKLKECLYGTQIDSNLYVKTTGSVDHIFVETAQDIKVKQVGAKTAKKLDTYYANKRRVTRFYANCIDTRKLYTKVVKDLLDTGKYRKLRQVWVNGGILWDLERIK